MKRFNLTWNDVASLTISVGTSIAVIWVAVAL